MSRKVVLDTETTGLDPAQGHRIIEIGCVELINRRMTAERFHRYVCPEREVDAGALAVHGIDNEFLADKPRFAEIAGELLEFLAGAEVLIHNAPFDVGFIDAELARIEPSPGRLADHCRVVDTLEMARRLHPGQRNGLDALCKRYAVDDSGRELHGALLDAGLLADVYLAMTGGQATLELVSATPSRAIEPGAARGRPRGSIAVVRADPDEIAAHRRALEYVDAASDGGCIWRALDE